MVKNLICRIFNRLEQLLPTELNYSLYSDVERHPIFSNARLALLNAGVTQGLQLVVDPLLEVIERIAEKNRPVSGMTSGVSSAVAAVGVMESYTEDVLHSLLVMLRLLNDITEVTWQSYEASLAEDEAESAREIGGTDGLYSTYNVGFSTEKEWTHAIAPPALETSAAQSLLRISNRFKTRSQTLAILKKIAGSLHRSGSHNSRIVLPDTLHNERGQTRSELLDKIDDNCEALMKYVAASNPQEYHSYINTRIISPLLVTQIQNETDIAIYLDAFSFYFITDRYLSSFLELVSKMVTSFKKSVYQEVLLKFVSQAMTAWILSRPQEYLDIIDRIKYQPEDQSTQKLIKEASFLFEEIYNSFSVTHILTESPTLQSTMSSPTSAGGSTSSIPGDGTSPAKGGNAAHSINSATIVITNSVDDSLRPSTVPDAGEHSNHPRMASNPNNVENITHISVLSFLACIVMLHPSAFEDVNSTSFRNIPDDPHADESKEDITDSLYATTSGATSVNSDECRIRHQHRRLKSFKKLTAFSAHSSTHHKAKFLSTLVDNLTGMHAVSDAAIFDSLRTLILISRLSASVFQFEKDTPTIHFSRRLFPVLCDSLQLCSEQNARRNPLIAKCLFRHYTLHSNLQIDYFPVACSLEPDAFNLRLQEYLEQRNNSLGHLHILTEGLKAYVSVQTNMPSEFKTLLATIGLLRRTAYGLSCVLIEGSPLFDGRSSVSAVIDDLLEGKLVDESNIDNADDGDSRIPSFMNAFVPKESMKSFPQTPSVPSFGSSSFNEKPPPAPFIFPSKSDHDAVRIRRPSMGSPQTTLHGRLTTTSSLPHDLERVQYSMRTGMDRGMRPPLRMSSRGRYGSQDSFMHLVSSTSFVGNEALQEVKKDASNLDIVRKIIGNIYTIYKDVLHFSMSVLDSEKISPLHIDDYKDVVKPIFAALIDDGADSQSAVKAYCYVGITCIDQLTGEYAGRYMPSVFKANGYLITLLAASLFNVSLTDSKREQIFSYLTDFWEFRHGIVKYFEKRGILSKISDEELYTFPVIRGATGRALCVSMYSHNPNIHKLLKIGFRLFHKEVENHHLINGHRISTGQFNMQFIRAMGRDSYVATGALAFQRRLRSDILLRIKHPDRILYDSLRLIYNHWYSLLTSQNRSSTSSNHFRNCAGFIAASCGVFLTTDADILEKFSYLYQVRDSMVEKIDYFIYKQCQSINNEDLLTRENSRDIVSSELHPLAFAILFKHLKKKTKDLFDIPIAEQENELHYVLLEQIILVIRVILERDDDTDVLICVSLDLIELLEDIFKIIELMPRDSPKYYKIIIQISKMLRSFEHSEQNICISGYMLIKNKWLRLTMRWFESTIFKDYDLENLGKPHRSMDLKRRDLDYLYIDTSIESSKALAYLTKDLVLEAPQSMSEKELSRSKEVVFGNYFTILLKGLEKSTGIKKFPPTLRHKIGMLNDNIITSLTNLLNYNVDVGFKYALPIGYSPNRNIKLAFLKVFVNIVSNFDVTKKRLEEERSAAIETLLDRAVEDPKLLSKAARVCPANDIDSLAGSFVTLYDIKNAAHLIVIELIIDEISRSTRYMDVLRRNSCATRSLSMFSRLKGGAYLINVLKPVLEEVVSTGETFDVEKIEPDDPDCQRNVDLFCKYLKKLVDSIVGSVADFPPEFFVICQSIYSSVKENFPESAEIAVGSFIFLRFFCPALVSPDSEGITDPLYPKARRSFMILAKVIQNIANGSVSSLKWPALQSEVEFLKTISDRIFCYLKEISDPTRKVEIRTRPANRASVDDFHMLHRFLYYHGLEIRREFINDVQSAEDMGRLRESCRLADRLLSLLGQPRMEFKSAISPYIRDHMDTNPELYEFMSRHSLKNILPEDTPFVREGVSPDGFPIIVLTWHLCDKILKRESDALVFRIFQIYSKVWTTSHYCVIDCTGFDCKKYEEPVRKLSSLFYKLIPVDAAKNCTGFYYYNMTENLLDLWLPIFKDKAGYLSGLKIPHHFINSNSPTKTISMLGLSDYSLEVYTDVRVTLHDASVYNSKDKKFYPVTLKIGNKHFQVVHDTSKQVKLGLMETASDVYFNDVFDIADIKSTGLSNEVGEPYEFTILMDNGKKLIFTSPKCLEILKIFYYSQVRLEEEFRDDEFGVSSLAHDRNKRKDITYTIGHILMIVFVGLTSEDDAAESVAYNLMAATQSTFDLDCGHKLTVPPEVYVSGDNSAFYNSILNTLAVTTPELCECIWTFALDLLENVLNKKQVTALLIALSPWTKNLYEYVYLANDEEGPEITTQIIRRLIRITMKQELHSILYAQLIFSNILLEGDLTELLFDEVIHHCVDRASEGAEWKRIIVILTKVPTTEVCGLVLRKIQKISNSFLPTLQLETSTHSWSELIILVEVAVSLVFDSLLLVQLHLPEILCIISLLIDVGPTELRSGLHRLLMNVCHSFVNNERLYGPQKENLNKISVIFSRQKLKFMFGFSQDKGRILQNFSPSSFLTKFTTLEHFISNIFELMSNASVNYSTVLFWKTKYLKYIMDVVTNVESFLSSRAMMIIGIISKNGINDNLCYKLLRQTFRTLSVPWITDESIFYAISHIFAYSKIVNGLQPTSKLLPQMFWFSTTYIRSPKSMVYQGGLLLMVNSAQRMSLAVTGENAPPLLSQLYKEREFVEGVLDEQGRMARMRFTESNFIHILMAYLSKGLLIPFVRSTAVDALITFFRLTFHRSHYQDDDNYLVFMLFIYLVQRPDHFNEMMKEMDPDSDIIALDDATGIDARILSWLENGSDTALFTLYQGAVYFSSRNSDEPGKIRYLLLLKHLVVKQPFMVFKVYNVIRDELGRINTYDVSNTHIVNVAFFVIRLMVVQKDYLKLDDIQQEMQNHLANRGLSGISDIDIDAAKKESELSPEKQIELIYPRKVQALQIVEQMLALSE
ncbi:AaceriAER025Cp [[Ashbya] aceris (nom. inval.)]|nr:AaceriAER025Cp [[Ashbya] aceris (nom. inval.)]